MNILIPIDGSAGSKTAAKVGLRIAKTHSAKIILLHVISATGQKRKKWMEEGAKKLGTHGKTGLKKLTGSVTEKVLRHSRVLVLVVPPKFEIK